MKQSGTNIEGTEAFVMTWERFEQTGTVEDYLLYKGLEPGKQRQMAFEGEQASACKVEHGTINNSDRHGAGSLSIWGLR